MDLFKQNLEVIYIYIDDSPYPTKRTVDMFHSEISKMVSVVDKLRHCVPLHTLLIIYRALILPYLSYGLIVWGQALIFIPVLHLQILGIYSSTYQQFMLIMLDHPPKIICI